MRKNIETVEGFIEWVNSLSGSSMIYRGLSDEYWEVGASASRRIKNSSNPSIFKEYVLDLLEAARQNGLGHRAGAELCDLELLADLQHNGAATCLIDFTQSPLTALWFACNDEPEESGRVIGMRTNNTDLFQIVDSKLREEKINFFFEEDILWKWQPRDINNRIIAQQSIFVFGEPTIKESHYDSVIIKQKSKAKLLEVLKEKYNISEVNLFRDMSGFSLANSHDKSYIGHSAVDYLLLGVNAHQKQEYKRAIEYYSKSIEINPNNTDTYSNRGFAKNYIDDYKGAIEDLDKAIEINPNNADTYNNRGFAKSALGKHKDAIEDLDKAIEINPNYTETYNNRGFAKSRLGDSKGAIEDYNKTIEINPNYAKAYSNRGTLKIRQYEYNGAIEDFNKAIEINPNNAGTYSNRGFVKNNLGDHKGAIEDFNKAIELNPNFANSYKHRGVVKGKLGNHKGAIEDYNKAIELNPNNAEAFNNRGIARTHLGDHKGARQDAKKAAELKNNSPDNASKT